MWAPTAFRCEQKTGPALIHSDFNFHKANYLKISKKTIEQEFISMSSMNCWIYEEDVGKICSFLISDDAKRISGQVIGVDGNALRLD